MKRFILAGLVMALFSGTAAFAQNNGGYVDDVYYNGSQAQQDAKADAKNQKKQQTQQQNGAERYNSSTGNNDGYNTDGDAQVYNNSYGNEDDSYIDYDDDSYTSRIRRFYYPMASVGYWGSVYSPFWYDPFYSNPYYGWGGWYTPGFSIGFGWGGGPYWNNCWGMNTWYGYGGFSSWYAPFGGWGYGGWGYGGGYWNGYYAGLYDGGRYNAGYGRGAVNYGPRGSRNGLMSNGVYGRNTGMRAANTRSNMVEPINGRAVGGRSGNIDRGANGNTVGSSRGMQVDAQRPGSGVSRNVGSRNDAIRLDNGRTMEVQQSAGNGREGQIQQQAPARRGFFGNVFRGNSENNVNRSSNNGGYERSVQPSRSYNNSNIERSAPSRSYSNPSPAPSRSYSSPSPSRSSFGGGGGGGSRMSSGGGRGR